MADLLTGVTLLGSGAILGARRSGRLRGMLLVSAGLGWFAVTARIAAFDQFTFVHRALVIHALVLTSLAAATGRREVARVIGFVVVVLGYVASIGGDRALSTAWVSTTGAVVVGATVLMRSRWSFVVPAVLGTGMWAAAAGAVRTSDWWSPGTRFAVYGCGLSVAAIAIVTEARRVTSRSTDIIREGGPVGLAIGFRAIGETDFTELDGKALVEDPQRSRRLDLGQELGEAIVVHRSPLPYDAGLERELVDAVRLLARHHHALLATNRWAAEIDAAQARLAVVDATVEADLEIEVDRLVTRRIMHAVDLLRIDDTDVARDARNSLAEVVSEVHQLINGLAPRILHGGLAHALLELARRQPSAVEVRIEIDDDDLDAAAAAALYFVVAECLSNAVRYASATAITVSVVAVADVVVVTVVDDGSGRDLGKSRLAESADEGGQKHSSRQKVHLCFHVKP